MAGRVWLIGDDPEVSEQLAGWFGDAGYGSERLGVGDVAVRLADGGAEVDVDGAVIDPGGYQPVGLGVLDRLLRAGVPGWPQVPAPVRIVLGVLALWLAWLAVVQARTVGINFLLSVMTLV